MFLQYIKGKIRTTSQIMALHFSVFLDFSAFLTQKRRSRGAYCRRWVREKGAGLRRFPVLLSCQGTPQRGNLN
jgi:hypothetical protein